MRGWLLLGLALAGCGGAAADHERLGDVAYAAGEYSNAVEEYRAATSGKPDARLWAKLGAAAFKDGQLRQAVEAYTRLAGADETRVVEAARGLEQVARAAGRAGEDGPLEEAVDVLRRLAPERVSPRHTLALVRSGHLAQAEAAGMGPLALAAAGDALSTDQMLVQYGVALQGTTACADAAEVFQTALRRSRDPAIRSKASQGLGDCALQLGQEALLVDRPGIAAQWFLRVLAADSTSARGRRALVGLGDARVSLGDLLGATLAYQDALRADATDSIGALASQRLTRLGATVGTADSQ